MNDSDLEQFNLQLDVLSEYAEKTLSEPMRVLYWECLKEFEISHIKMGIIRYMKNPEKRRFMPAIGEIIAEIEKLKENEIPPVVIAMHEWEQVVDQINSKGTYTAPEFDDEVTDRVVKSMGWRDLCMTPTSEMVWKRKDFVDRYISYINYPTLLQNNKNLRLTSNSRPLAIDFDNGSHETNQITRAINEVFRKVP